MLFRIKQEICLYVSKVRCLSSNPNGRYSLRFCIYQCSQNGRKFAIPVNAIEISQQSPKYELAQNYYITKPFIMKANSQSIIEQLCVFKIDTKMLNNKNDESSTKLELTCELIQSDYGYEKIVGVFQGKISDSNIRECLMIDFCQLSACQVLGMIHSCSYQYQFCASQQYLDFQAFCETQNQQYVEQLISYLFKVSKKSQTQVKQHCRNINILLGNYEEQDTQIPLSACSQTQADEDNSQKLLESPNQQKIIEQMIEKNANVNTIPKQFQIDNTQNRCIIYTTKQTQQTHTNSQKSEKQRKQRKRRKIFTKQNRKIFKKQSDKKRKNVSIDQFQRIMHQNSLRIYSSWKQIITMLMEKDVNTVILQSYQIQYLNKMRKLMGQSVVRFKGSWDVDHFSKQQAQRNKMALQLRQMTEHSQIYTNQFKFYNKRFFSKNRPIYFQEGASNENLKNTLSKIRSFEQNQHIIFLVHGLGACRLDMEKLKIQLKRYYPRKATIHISTANEGRTQGNIDSMGLRLASEVSHYLSRVKGYNRISFIGHSMGGVIIRSALPRLQSHAKYFYSLITLSSPHIGYNYSSSKLIDAGIWMINNWQKCQSLMQLTLSDSYNQQQCFLYKLSLQSGLQWFKKITFVGSHQDLYVPYYSARIQKHDQCIKDQQQNKYKGIIHNTMINNILNRIKCSLTRIDVNFNITQQNIDNFIGRAAHINFIQNVDMLRVFILMGQNLLF